MSKEAKQSKVAKKAERELYAKNAANAENLFPVGVMVTVDGGRSASILTHLPSLLPSGWWVCGVHNIGAVRCERVELVKEVHA